MSVKSKDRWMDPEYKRRVSQAISDGWKRRREERERLEALKPKPEPYHVPDLPGEEWRDVLGFEGQYAVSNMGRIKSLDRILPHEEHGTRHIRERLLKQKASGPGENHYFGVMLHTGHGKMVHRRIHRMVAETFLPNPDSKNQINHIDGNKANNALSNLEWCTSKENMDHAWRMGLCENIVTCKARAVQNVETGEIFQSMRAAERHYNVAFGAIGHAVRKGKTSLGYHWRYVESEANTPCLVNLAESESEAPDRNIPLQRKTEGR